MAVVTTKPKKRTDQLGLTNVIYAVREMPSYLKINETRQVYLYHNLTEMLRIKDLG